MKNRLGKHFQNHKPMQTKIDPDYVYFIDDDHIYTYDRLHKLTPDKRKSKKNN